jgi:hypothetical protein
VPHCLIKVQIGGDDGRALLVTPADAVVQQVGRPGIAGQIPEFVEDKQVWVGHASIEMTQRYAHLAPDYLGREVARLNFVLPRDGKVLSLHNARQSQ